MPYGGRNSSVFTPSVLSNRRSVRFSSTSICVREISFHARMRVGVVADFVAFVVFALEQAQSVVGAAADHKKRRRRFFLLSGYPESAACTAGPARRRNSARSFYGAAPIWKMR